MNFTPLKQKCFHAISRSPITFRERSTRRWIIHPAERLSARPAIHLDHDLEKVTAVMHDTTFNQERERIAGGDIEHAATEAFEILNCEILDGSLYKGALRHPLSKESRRFITGDFEQEYQEASLASTYYGSFYFGHWMTDDLTLHLITADIAPTVISARKCYSHESGYRKLMRVTSSPIHRAYFRRLIVLDDFGQNSHKRFRYEELRSRLRKAITPTGNERIWIRRGSSGASRDLTNAKEIEGWLVDNNFTIVEPESLSPRSIAEAISGARLVGGLEGSHMVHGLFNMADEGTLFLLQPPYRFNNVLKNYTDCLGMTYAFLTGRAATGGFHVNLNDMKRLLEKLD